MDSTPEPVSTDSESTPKQPRSRLRRWARILLIVLACLAAVAGGWAWHIKRQEARMLAHVEELRLAWEDTRVMPAPEENAADLSRQAFGLMVDDEKIRELRKRAYQGELDFRGDEVGDILQKNSECLKLLTEAVRRPHCQLMADYSRGVLGKPDVDVMKVLKLGILLDLQARRSAMVKAPAEALEDVLALFKLARHASACESLLGQLGCSGLVDMGLRAFEVLLGRHELSEAELDRAFAEITNVARTRTPLIASMRAEKVMMLVTISRIAAGMDDMSTLNNKGKVSSDRSYADRVQFLGRWTGQALKEVQNLETDLDWLIKGVELRETDDGQTLMDLKASLEVVNKHPSWLLDGRVFSRIVVAPLAIMCRGGSSRVSPVQLDLVRIGLALELYRLRHGRHPESLDALCADMPEKFPAVPQDPFAKAPLRYERTATTTRVWSVENDNIRSGEKPRTDLILELPK